MQTGRHVVTEEDGAEEDDSSSAEGESTDSTPREKSLEEIIDSYSG